MTQTANIRVFLVEDQTLVRDALCQLLNLQDDFTVVGSAANGLAAQKGIADCQPDLVLSDIEMPECDGLTLCRWLRDHHPKIATVILTTFNRSGYVQRALQSGARVASGGYDKGQLSPFNGVLRLIDHNRVQFDQLPCADATARHPSAQTWERSVRLDHRRHLGVRRIYGLR